MATEFFLPDVGEGLAEAVIISWYVELGGEVTMDEPLVEVETDKAVVDIPSPVGGTLLFQGAAAGDTLEVDALLAVVGAAGEAWSREAAAEGGIDGSAAAPIVGSLEEATSLADVPHDGPQALPKVRRLATELGVDLATVVGTGPGGRISESDVRDAVVDLGPVRRSRMTPTRRTIAEHLSRSWQEIPHVTTYGEVDATPLLEARRAGGGPPLEALLIARIVPLLREFPVFNASISGDEIIEKLHYDIGFAVDTPEGLMVAVVRDADSKDVATLGVEVRRLADAARERRATRTELHGQTFTVSNIGAVGGRYGTPIIPYGTTAIVSIGRADPRPVVRGDAVVVGLEFPISLSYDHRVIDGGTGRAFMGGLIDAFSAR